MNKLETLAEKLDTAIRFVLKDTEFDTVGRVCVQIHHAPLTDGVDWEWRASPVLRTYPVANVEHGKYPGVTTVTVFPSIPDTQLATDEDQPF